MILALFTIFPHALTPLGFSPSYLSVGFPSHIGVKIDVSLSECSLIQKDTVTVQKLELEDTRWSCFRVKLQQRGNFLDLQSSGH